MSNQVDSGVRLLRSVLRPVLLGGVTTLGIVVVLAIVVEYPESGSFERFDIGAQADQDQFVLRAFGSEFVMQAEGPWAVYEMHRIVDKALGRRERTPQQIATGRRAARCDFCSALQDPYAYAVEARGWPALCFSSEFYYSRGMDSPELFTVAWGITMAVRESSASAGSSDADWWRARLPRIIPLRPIWCGLIKDVTIYSCGWWVLLFAVRSSKRIGRRLRGRCPSCAYDLRRNFSSGCPECGWRRTEKDAQQPA